MAWYDELWDTYGWGGTAYDDNDTSVQDTEDFFGGSPERYNYLTGQSGGGSDLGSTIGDLLTTVVMPKTAPFKPSPPTTSDYINAAAMGIGGIGGLLFPDLLFGSNKPAGYRGSVPSYDAVRSRVPNTYDPNRRPGSGGQRYFSDVQFVPKGEGSTAMEQTAAEAKGLEALNLANPASYPVETMNTGGGVKKYSAAGLIELIGQNPQIIDLLAYLTAGTGLAGLGAVGLKKYKETDKKDFNTGGIAAIGKSRRIDGSTDGMADDVPAIIDNAQPAALSDGEYVIAADVVSHLGNGNTDAGAKELDNMMGRIREARTGTTKQAPEIDPQEFLLA